MNVLILVGTLEEHAEVVDREWLTLILQVDVNARLNELLECDLPTTFFGFKSYVWLPKQTKVGVTRNKLPDDQRFLIEAWRDLYHSAWCRIVDGFLDGLEDAFHLAVADVLVDYQDLHS